MSRLAEKIDKPYLVVVASVVLSVTTLLIVSMIIDIGNIKIAFSLAVIVPAIVSSPIAVVLVGYIQKIKKQREELIKLDDINKKLFSLIAHDIRSPISNLKNMMDLIINGHIDKKEEEKYLGLLSVKTENLLVFLSDLLKWSQDQITNKPPELELFQVLETINSIGDLHEDLLTKKNIKFVLENLNNTVYADQQNYAFVVRNIIHNAIKFTPINGEIVVSTALKHSNVHTIIKDSGVGMSGDDIKNLLDREKWFTQTGTQNEVGTGFGINTCIEYLEKNNGRLLIESKPGNGTTVTVILPNKPIQ